MRAGDTETVPVLLHSAGKRNACKVSWEKQAHGIFVAAVEKAPRILKGV